jgi:hypothetical protein
MAFVPTSSLPWPLCDGIHVYIDNYNKKEIKYAMHIKKRITLVLKDESHIYVDDQFFVFNPDIHTALSNFQNIDDSEWGKTLVTAIGSAWAYKAASVEPPEDY